jgi:hypothetical protein
MHVRHLLIITVSILIDRVIETAKTLVKQLPLSMHPLAHCLHLDQHTLSTILEVLTYWSTPLQKSTTKFLDILNRAETQVDTKNDREAAEIYEKRVRSGEKIPTSAFDDLHGERTIFRRAKILLPPKAHISRFPVLSKVAESYSTATSELYDKLHNELGKTWKPNPTLFVILSDYLCQLI